MTECQMLDDLPSDLLERMRDAVAATTRLPPQTPAQRRFGDLTKTAGDALLNFMLVKTEEAREFAELAVGNLELAVKEELRVHLVEGVMES